MTIRTVVVSFFGKQIGEGRFNTRVDLGPIIPAVPVLPPDTNEVDVQVGVLIDDGATPSSEHVLDLKAAWDAYLAELAAFNVPIVPIVPIIAKPLSLVIDTSIITTQSKLKAAVMAALQQIPAFSILPE